MQVHVNEWIPDTKIRGFRAKVSVEIKGVRHLLFATIPSNSDTSCFEEQNVRDPARGLLVMHPEIIGDLLESVLGQIKEDVARGRRSGRTALITA